MPKISNEEIRKLYNIDKERKMLPKEQFMGCFDLDNSKDMSLDKFCAHVKSQCDGFDKPGKEIIVRVQTLYYNEEMSFDIFDITKVPETDSAVITRLRAKEMQKLRKGERDLKKKVRKGKEKDVRYKHFLKLQKEFG